jgi:putative transposase
MVRPEDRKKAVAVICEMPQGLSVRRACRLVGLERATYRYQPLPDRNRWVVERLKMLAARYPRYGSPMLYNLFRNEGHVINHKRIERLYRLEKLSLRRKRSRKRLRHLRAVLPTPARPDEVWSMDFIHDRLTNGRQLKCLTIVDHCTREAPSLHADHSIRGQDVVGVLDGLWRKGRKPAVLVSDNGSEFTSKAMAKWAQDHGVLQHFIEPGKPTQNAYCESFNGKFRDECLNLNWFATVAEARLIIESWRKEYENVRPHSGLKGKTPRMAAEAFLTTQLPDSLSYQVA